MKTHRVVMREVDRDIFDQVVSGVKTIETRAGTPKYRAVEVGDSMLFVCGKDSFVKQIKSVRHFDSLDTLFDELPMQEILPQTKTREEAYAVYHSFPNYKEKLAEFGVVAFELG